MAEHQSVWMSKITNGGLTRMLLYSCTDVATVSIKGLYLILLYISGDAD